MGHVHLVSGVCKKKNTKKNTHKGVTRFKEDRSGGMSEDCWKDKLDNKAA